MDNELQNCNMDNLPAETTQDPISACVATMDLDEKEKRNLAFMLHVIVGGISPSEAAGRIGMHRNSGPRLWKELNDVKSGRGLMQKFIQKTQDTFRVKTALKLDRVSGVEDQVLTMLEKDPEMAAKFPALLRQIKTVGGVLADPVPVQPVINIQAVQNMMLNMGNEGK
jgi:hypothetical protein